MLAAILVLSDACLIAQVATSPHTVSQVVDFWVTNTEQLVVPAADAMPEGKYSFAPSSGEFSGVRTFAEQVTHLAAANYQLAAGTLGEEPPAGTDHETAPDSVKTKAQILSISKGRLRLSTEQRWHSTRTTWTIRCLRKVIERAF
jgi:hypothetical protein